MRQTIDEIPSDQNGIATKAKHDHNTKNESKLA